MSSTKMGKLTLALIFAGAALSGCLSAGGHLSPDYGAALSQNLAAQVADPDAVYDRTMEPASNGQRAADASDRYVRGEVKQPVSQSTSQVRSRSNGGSEGGGGGGEGGQ